MSHIIITVGIVGDITMCITEDITMCIMFIITVGDKGTKAEAAAENVAGTINRIAFFLNIWILHNKLRKHIIASV